MESIKQIYRIGHGPSSSHTMGPMRAARMFLERNQGAVRFNVTLYGSLAATGKGHMTDAAILEVLSPVAKTNITWCSCLFIRTASSSSRLTKAERNWITGRFTVSGEGRWQTKPTTS